MEPITQLNTPETGNSNPSFPKHNKHPQTIPTNSFPLSYNQKSIWLLHMLEPDGVANNISQAIRFQNEVDPQIFNSALQTITDRHPALRTTFTIKDGQPIQVIHDSQTVFFQHADTSEWDEETLNQQLTDRIYQRFDLENGPLFRAFLFTRAANDHVFLLTMHHIITDMWSVAVFLKDLFTAYQNEATGKGRPLPTLKYNYVDYVKDQQMLLAGPEGVRLQSYWKKQLSGTLPTLNLPTDRPRQRVKNHHGSIHPLPLGPSLTNSLNEIANAYDVTLFSVVLAAFQILLGRYSGQDDILVGTPKAGRSFKTARLLGYFINQVLLRADLSDNPPFAAFVQQVHQTVEDAFEHDAYPFQKLQEDLQLSRGSSTKPFFQVTYAWQKSMKLGGRNSVTSGAVGNKDIQTFIKGFVAAPIPVTERVSPYELSLLAGDVGDELVVTFLYKRDLFDAATIARMADHFEMLLHGIVADPNQPIHALPFITPAEAQKMLVDWNDTAVPAITTSPTCLHHLFEVQAAKTPRATALIFEDTKLTYEQLNQRANQLAHFLRQEHNVKPGSLVAIQLQRSFEMIIGILGILKAGGSYIPLDPTHPPARQAYVLKDTNATLLLTQKNRPIDLPPFAGKTLYLDTIQALLTNQPNTNPEGNASPDALAYITYTSGSTGRPKGVTARHRSVTHHLTFLAQNYGVNEQDIIIQIPTISFDASVRDIFTPLISGAQVVILSEMEAASPRAIAARMQKHSATCILSIVPSLLSQLLAEANKLDWPEKSLRLLLTSGEALQVSYCRQAKEIFSSTLEVVNQYGPTECTMTSTFHRVDIENNGSQYALIGKPVANTQIYLLDKYLNPVPIGLAGEVHIGGVEVSPGYLNRPELTAEKFIADPFSNNPDARLYKTGDLARYLPDGTLEFIGRIDNQVKIRGFRVELGEIEAALIAHPSVREAVAIIREDQPGDKRLVAYLIGDETQPQLSQTMLRNFLAEKLPIYMIPAAFVSMESFPKTPNQKVDRLALPVPDLAHADFGRQYSAPRNALEEILASLMAETLNLDRVGIGDNFFAMGGHSLLATRFLFRVTDMFGVELPLRSFFEAPTVADIAALMLADNSERARIERTAQLLVKLSQLSDDEVTAMLEKRGNVQA